MLQSLRLLVYSLKILCFNPTNKTHRVAFVTLVNSVCVQMHPAIRGVHAAFNKQLPRVIAERAIHHVIVMDGRSFGQSQ